MVVGRRSPSWRAVRALPWQPGPRVLSLDEVSGLPDRRQPGAAERRPSDVELRGRRAGERKTGVHELPASDRGDDHSGGGSESDHDERRYLPGNEENEADESDEEVRMPVDCGRVDGVVERGAQEPDN